MTLILWLAACIIIGLFTGYFACLTEIKYRVRKELESGEQGASAIGFYAPDEEGSE